MVGPHPQAGGGGGAGKDPSPGPTLHASKDQILQFFLTTFKSFVHPLVLTRLLLHRLSSPPGKGEDSSDLFDWSRQDPAPLSPTIHLVSVPGVQLSVLNVIGRWLELYPDDFLTYPHVRQEVDKVVSRLKLVRGSYIPHTHRLR